MSADTTTHEVDLGRIPRPHLGPLFKPSCSCGDRCTDRPTPDIEEAKRWRRRHLASTALTNLRKATT